MNEGITEIEVECKLCKAKYKIKMEDFDFALRHNNGWYPCQLCGSRATKWVVDGD